MRIRHDRWPGLLAALALAWAAGCNRPPEGATPGARGIEDTAADGRVEFEEVLLKDWDGVLARHRGQVVLVDFWALF
jgi:hypothetical protein